MLPLGPHFENPWFIASMPCVGEAENRCLSLSHGGKIREGSLHEGLFGELSDLPIGILSLGQ